MQLTPGRYPCKILDYNLDVSKNGHPFVVIACEIYSPMGVYVDTLNYRGYLKGAHAERNINMLKQLGLKGDVKELIDGKGGGALTNINQKLSCIVVHLKNKHGMPMYTRHGSEYLVVKYFVFEEVKREHNKEDVLKALEDDDTHSGN